LKGSRGQRRRKYLLKGGKLFVYDQGKTRDVREGTRGALGLVRLGRNLWKGERPWGKQENLLSRQKSKSRKREKGELGF